MELTFVGAEEGRPSPSTALFGDAAGVNGLAAGQPPLAEAATAAVWARAPPGTLTIETAPLWWKVPHTGGDPATNSARAVRDIRFTSCSEMGTASRSPPIPEALMSGETRPDKPRAREHARLNGERCSTSLPSSLKLPENLVFHRKEDKNLFLSIKKDPPSRGREKRSEQEQTWTLPGSQRLKRTSKTVQRTRSEVASGHGIVRTSVGELGAKRRLDAGHESGKNGQPQEMRGSRRSRTFWYG